MSTISTHAVNVPSATRGIATLATRFVRTVWVPAAPRVATRSASALDRHLLEPNTARDRGMWEKFDEAAGDVDDVVSADGVPAGDRAARQPP